MSLKTLRCEGALALKHHPASQLDVELASSSRESIVESMMQWVAAQLRCSLVKLCAVHMFQQPADPTKDKQSDDRSSEYFQRIQAAYAALAKAGLA